MSSLDSEELEAEMTAQNEVEEEFDEDSSYEPFDPQSSPFAPLGLHEAILEAADDSGYERATPLQERAIPPLLAGGDLLLVAPAGVGRTAAWLLPLLHAIEEDAPGLVLVPGELRAARLRSAVEQFAEDAPLTILTPADLAEFDGLAEIAHFVVDGADEIALEEVAPALAGLSGSEQAVLVVAELADAVARFAEHHLSEPQTVRWEETRGKPTKLADTEFRHSLASEGMKLGLLLDLLTKENGEGRAVVWTRRATTAEETLDALLERQLSAELLPAADEDAELRAAALERWAQGDTAVLIATDVSGPEPRELGKRKAALVVHRDLPYDGSELVRRSARANIEKGAPSYFFVNPAERGLWSALCEELARESKPRSASQAPEQAVQRIDTFKKNVLAALERSDLDLELQLVHELSATGNHDPSEVAAAILRVARGEESLDEVDLVPHRPRQQREMRRERGGDRPQRDNQAWRDVEPGMTRFALNCGRWGGVRPADIVRSFAENCDFPGSEVGAIKIFDRFSLVDVPKQYEHIVLERMPGTDLRGRTVAIRIDEGPQPRDDQGGPRRMGPPRRDRDDRGFGGDRMPRSGYGPPRSNYGDARPAYGRRERSWDRDGD